MKRKSLLLVVSVACISVMLAACTGDVSAEVEPADEEVVLTSVEAEPEAGVAEITEADAEVETEVAVEAEPEPEQEPEVDPNVELSMQFLEASEDWLIENNTLGFERDGQTYSLAYYVPTENMDKTGLGVYSSKFEKVFIYGTGDVGSDQIVMNDSFVIPVVTAEDEAYWYGEDGTSSIELLPIEFYGYTIPLLSSDEVVTYISDYSDLQSSANGDVWDYKKKGFKVLDADGNECSDIRGLNQGESYKICWTDSGDHEQEMTASAVYYKINGESISIEGQTTDDPNKVSFDLSSLPAGTYFCVESEGLFTIE